MFEKAVKSIIRIGRERRWLIPILLLALVLLFAGRAFVRGGVLLVRRCVFLVRWPAVWMHTQKNKRGYRQPARILAITLVMCMTVSMMPLSAFAAGMNEAVNTERTLEGKPASGSEADEPGVPETVPETTPETKPETMPETKPETTPETKPEEVPETKPETEPEANPEPVCTCEVFCTEENIDDTCPVCGGEDGDPAACEGQKPALFGLPKTAVHEHPVCGDNECAGNHSSHDSKVAYKALDDGTGAILAENLSGNQIKTGSYYLAEDVDVPNSLYINDAVNICLNGKRFLMDTDQFIELKNTLNLCDCRGGGIVETEENGKTLSVESAGTANIYGGTLKGDATLGVVKINYGRCNIYGGQVQNTFKNGYGVDVKVTSANNGKGLSMAGAPDIPSGILIDDIAVVMLSGQMENTETIWIVKENSSAYKPEANIIVSDGSYPLKKEDVAKFDCRSKYNSRSYTLELSGTGTSAVAKLVPRICSVTYDAGGGIGTIPPPESVQWGESVTLAQNPGNLTNGDKIFRGWRILSSEAGEDSYVFSPGEGSTIRSDTIFIAVWEDRNLSLTIGGNTTCFYSLNDALKAAFESTQDAATIRVEKSFVDVFRTAEVWGTTAITLDLNGKTVTLEELVLGEGALTITGGGAIKGSITQHDGSLTIKNGTFTALYVSDVFNSGERTTCLEGGTFTGEPSGGDQPSMSIFYYLGKEFTSDEVLAEAEENFYAMLGKGRQYGKPVLSMIDYNYPIYYCEGPMTIISSAPGTEGGVEEKPGTPEVTVPREDLIDAAVTEEEKNDPDIANINVTLTVEKKEEPADKNLVEAKLSQEHAVGLYLDIALIKRLTYRNSDESTNPVHEAANKITISIVLPEELRGSSEYGIIRVHDYGNQPPYGSHAELLPAAYDAGTYTLTFETDRFSTYAITYIPEIDKYPLTLNGGGTGAVGSGMYEAGVSVSINAGTKDGYTFDGWSSAGGGSFGDVNAPDTTFTMPAGAASITAGWKKDADGPAEKYPLTLNGGEAGAVGAGVYAAGASVSINAGLKEGYIFAGWSCAGGGSFGDVNAPITTFTMPAGAVTITAGWKKDTGGQENNSGRSSGGAAYTEGWVQSENGTWQYRRTNGHYLKDCWQLLDYNGQTNWYCFGADGTMLTGWIDAADGFRYYMNPISDGSKGAMLTGWVQIEGRLYYFNPTPTADTGWRYDAARNEWIYGGGTTPPTGAMLRNTMTPDGNRVGADGARLD